MRAFKVEAGHRMIEQISLEPGDIAFPPLMLRMAVRAVLLADRRRKAVKTPLQRAVFRYGLMALQTKRIHITTTQADVAGAAVLLDLRMCFSNGSGHDECLQAGRQRVSGRTSQKQNDTKRRKGLTCHFNTCAPPRHEPARQSPLL